jgi:hypothetical protein
VKARRAAQGPRQRAKAAAAARTSPNPLAELAAHRAAPRPTVTTDTIAASVLTQPVAAAAELVAESGIGTETREAPSGGGPQEPHVTKRPL